MNWIGKKTFFFSFITIEKKMSNKSDRWSSKYSPQAMENGTQALTFAQDRLNERIARKRTTAGNPKYYHNMAMLLGCCIIVIAFVAIANLVVSSITLANQ
jgi:uncharacterized protein YqhQ